VQRRVSLAEPLGMLALHDGDSMSQPAAG